MGEFNEPLSRNEAILQNILGASNELEEPKSRIEEILQSILYDTEYTDEPQSRIEELLLAIKNSGEYDKQPLSRNEKILIAKLNGLEYKETTYSRIEELLKEWTLKIPSIYQEVEYIESTGSQYIDTGVLNKGALKSKITFVYTDLSSQQKGNLFGIYDTTTGDRSYINLTSGNKWQFGYGNGNYYFVSNNSPIINTKYELEGIWASTQQKLTINGNVMYSGSETITKSDAVSAYLFGTNGTNFHGCLKLYSCIIFDGENIIRNFIPCYRKSDGEIGLYDIVNGVFYTNEGTGTFVKGQNV